MMVRLRRHALRALLGLCAGAAIGWAISASAHGAERAVEARAAASAPFVCALGRACTGSAGCAGDCDPNTSLISGCARCVKGVFTNCSQGQCQEAMPFPAAALDEPLCPNQLMTPCATFGDMCTIGHTAHRCRCSTVGPGELPKWICK
ncbi:MAG TPA: hypothetical protein VKQ32_19810 [Polyangia bacterium]|nr:hypothetical protein [Polyangia bacterium]